MVCQCQVVRRGTPSRPWLVGEVGVSGERWYKGGRIGKVYEGDDSDGLAAFRPVVEHVAVDRSRTPH